MDGSLEKNGNTLYIHNSNSTVPLIYGNFSSSSLTINGSVNITGTISANGVSGISTTATMGTKVATFTNGLLTSLL
jgi:hypothetical protein